MIWNKSIECMSRDELADLQGKRLVKLVKYTYENTKYYRKKMRQIGLEPGDIRGIADLDKLPFTTRDDLMEEYPMGVFVIPDSNVVRYYASDAIAGYTQNDIDVWVECMARSVSMAELGKKDIIQVVYNCGLCTDGLGAHCGAEKAGAAVIPVSGYKPSALIAVMRRMRATGIISTSSYLMRVAKAVEERGLKDSLWLKAAICGGEFWTEDIRKKIQDKLGIKVYDIYGLDELTGLGVAGECERQNGMHIQEDFFLAEVLDPCTLIALPGGIRGELIFTTLQKEGLPLIRYRTMNLTRIYYEKCECGRTTARIDRICRRADDIFVIRGNSVYAFQIEAALSALSDIAASYIIYIRREQNLDMVDICIESGSDNGIFLSGRAESVKGQVADAVTNIIGMRPNVYFAKGEGVKSLVGLSADRKVAVVDERRY